MKYIFIIIAKSASGKDTLYAKLMENEEIKEKVKPYILYNSRPMRPNEKNNVNYRFVSQEEIEKIIEKENTIYSTHYDTNYGGCDVALVDDDQIKEDGFYITIMSAIFYNEFVKYIFETKDGKEKDIKLIPIYIEVSAKSRMERSMKREELSENPNYKEICRRFIADEQDFNEFQLRNIPNGNVFINEDFEPFFEDVKDNVLCAIHGIENENNKKKGIGEDEKENE